MNPLPDYPHAVRAGLRIPLVKDDLDRLSLIKDGT